MKRYFLHFVIAILLISSATATNTSSQSYKSLTQAQAAAKQKGRLLLAFYAPENKRAEYEFQLQSSAYKEIEELEISRNNEEDVFYVLYLMTEKDQKWLKNHKITPKNQYFIFDGDDLIYYQEGEIISPYELLTDTYIYEVFHSAAKAKELDMILTNPESSLNELEKAFFSIVNDPYYSPFVLSQRDNPSVSQQYFEHIDNLSMLYQPKVTPEQLNKHWERIINAHKNEKDFNLNYAKLLGANFASWGLSAHNGYYYYYSMKDKQPDLNDLEAITYLISHKEDIKAHNISIRKKEGYETDYDPHDYVSSELRKAGIVPFSMPTLREKLQHKAYTSDPSLKKITKKLLLKISDK